MPPFAAEKYLLHNAFMPGGQNHPAEVDVPRLRRRLLSWYDRCARKLPWRSRADDPYAVWLSEMMLQQTQTTTVMPYFERFLTDFPDVQTLAGADREAVLSRWAGLGYYRRAHLLHEAARMVADEFGGRFPESVEGLMRLPGVGRYSAGAIASIAFDVSAPILDGNVKRVLARVFAISEPQSEAATIARLWALSSRVIPQKRCGDFNQAMMDIGATVCSVKAPDCKACPLSPVCLANQQGLTGEIPPPRVRAKATVMNISVFVIETGRHVLLHQRGDSGLWAGMWALPCVETNGRSIAEIRASALPENVQSSVGNLTRGGEVKHQLTHRTVRFKIHRGASKKVRLPKSYRWALISDDLPLPKAFQKVLAV